MTDSVSNTKIIHLYEYDEVDDMLYIFIEPFRGWTFYQSIADDPSVMRRYSAADERLVGFTVENVKNRLSSNDPQEEVLRSLATRIVDQYV